MRQLSYSALKMIKEQDDKWVKSAYDIVANIRDKERQLRIIQNMAEGSKSWEAVKLFIKYQAARNQFKSDWAEEAIRQLEELLNEAMTIANKFSKDDPKDIHMELVSRVLGFAVRKHVWDNMIYKQQERVA